MSIVGSNRKRGNMADRAHAWVSANIAAALHEPSKADLREMLAEAVQNTARISTDEGVK